MMQISSIQRTSIPKPKSISLTSNEIIKGGINLNSPTLLLREWTCVYPPPVISIPVGFPGIALHKKGGGGGGQQKMSILSHEERKQIGRAHSRRGGTGCSESEFATRPVPLLFFSLTVFPGVLGPRRITSVQACLVERSLAKCYHAITLPASAMASIKDYLFPAGPPFHSLQSR